MRIPTPAAATRLGAPRGITLRRAEIAALVVLAVAAFVGFAIYPTYPNYDSLYSLLWGREILDGHLPSFDAYRAPTQHPLWVALGVVLAPIGESADRVLLAITVASFVALVAALYALGKATFGVVVGAVAALLLLSRLDFPFFAARGYIDVPYLALVIWAGALEARTPRRGGPVWVLLGLAGLLRPEAWGLAAVYAVWVSWGRPFGAWVRAGLAAAVAPAIWMRLGPRGHRRRARTRCTTRPSRPRRSAAARSSPSCRGSPCASWPSWRSGPCSWPGSAASCSRCGSRGARW